MDLYEYILECPAERHYYYYSWQEKPDKVVSTFIKSLRSSDKGAIDIIDVFPEPNVREITLAEPLQIQTACGKGMWLPQGFKVTLHGAYRVLYEHFNDE